MDYLYVQIFDNYYILCRFDLYKVVNDGIANCIRSKFELARPSWKKFPESTREMWFEEFKVKNLYILIHV